VRYGSGFDGLMIVVAAALLVGCGSGGGSRAQVTTGGTTGADAAGGSDTGGASTGGDTGGASTGGTGGAGTGGTGSGGDVTGAGGADAAGGGGTGGTGGADATGGAAGVEATGGGDAGGTTGGDTGGTAGGDTGGTAGADASGGDAGSPATAGGAGAGGAGGAQSAGGAGGAPSGDTWTLMVYLQTDCDLEPFGLVDLDEMMSVGSSPDFTILVQADRAAGYSSEAVGGLGDWETAKRLRVESGSLTELADLGEVNMGESATLAEFMEWSITTAPADKYGVVFWDHGGAWPIFGPDASHAHDGLTLAEIQTGLSAGMSAAGQTGRLHFVGFDACLMATYETALAMAPYSYYLLASENVEPGHGWDYASLTSVTGASTAEELGQALLAGYQQQAVDSETGASITLSLLDLNRMSSVQTAVDSLATAIGGANTETYAQTVASVRSRSFVFGQSTGMVDLGRFATDLAAADSSLSPVSADMTDAVGSAIVGMVNGPAQATATGLTIYFPESQSSYDADYDGLGYASSWRDFLQGYFNAGTSITTATAFVGADPIYVSDDDYILDGYLASGTASQIAEAVMHFAVVTANGDLLYLGEEPAAVSMDDIVTGIWDGTALIVSQGATWDYAYYSITVADGGYWVLSIPFDYYAGGAGVGEVVYYEVVFDEQINLVSETFYQNVGGAWGELVIQPGSTMMTMLPFEEGAAGSAVWADQVETFDATQPFSLSFDPVASGTNIYMDLVVTDFGGNSALAYDTGVLP